MMLKICLKSLKTIFKLHLSDKIVCSISTIETFFDAIKSNVIVVAFSPFLIQIDRFRDEKVNLPFSIVIFSLVQGSLCHSLAALVLYQVMFCSFQVYIMKYFY